MPVPVPEALAGGMGVAALPEAVLSPVLPGPLLPVVPVPAAPAGSLVAGVAGLGALLGPGVTLSRLPQAPKLSKTTKARASVGFTVDWRWKVFMAVS